jgi:hypothetical protein
MTPYYARKMGLTGVIFSLSAIKEKDWHKALDTFKHLPMTMASKFQTQKGWEGHACAVLHNEQNETFHAINPWGHSHVEDDWSDPSVSYNAEHVYVIVNEESTFPGNSNFQMFANWEIQQNLNDHVEGSCFYELTNENLKTRGEELLAINN